MRAKLALLVLGLAGLAWMIAGCGGGGGDGSLPGVQLSIIGDTAPTQNRVSATRADTIVRAPLDAGAAVTVYGYMTGQVLATGTLDASGRCNVTVTSGLTVVVVITGTRTVDSVPIPYRLSSIIGRVPPGGGEYIVDPATTIAAEAIATKHPMGSGTALDQGTVDQALEAATSYVMAHLSDDYSVGGGLIGGSSFGEPGSIDTAKVADVVAAVPDIIDNNVVAAKNAVQQIKEMGIPLPSMFSQERTDIEGILTNEITAKYTALWTRLSELIIPAHSSLTYGGVEVRVTELTMGQAYKVTDYNSAHPIIVDDPANNQPGQITLTYETPPGETPAGVYTVVARQEASRWICTQQFSGDPEQLYTFDTPDLDLQGNPVSPSYTVTVNLRDKDFTTPLTFDGTITAQGIGTYQVVLDGSLTSAELNSSGALEANFPSSLPEGADPDSDSIYEFPTSLSMSNANVAVSVGGTTVTLTGNIAVATILVSDDTGLTVKPKTVSMLGIYSNSHTGLSFDGSITGDWTNPPADDPTTANGSLRMCGELTRAGHPAYYADLVFALDSGTATLTVDFRLGTDVLRGTCTGTLSAEGDVTSGSLQLTNQDGVQLNFTLGADGTMSGDLKAGGERTATITKEHDPLGDRLDITYTDGTFDSIYL